MLLMQVDCAHAGSVDGEPAPRGLQNSRCCRHPARLCLVHPGLGRKKPAGQPRCPPHGCSEPLAPHQVRASRKAALPLTGLYQELPSPLSGVLSVETRCFEFRASSRPKAQES